MDGSGGILDGVPCEPSTPPEHAPFSGTPQGTPQTAAFGEQFDDGSATDIRRTQVTKSGTQWCWWWFEVTDAGAKRRRRAYGGTWRTLSAERKEQYYVNRERYWQRKANADHRREIAEFYPE